MTSGLAGTAQGSRPYEEHSQVQTEVRTVEHQTLRQSCIEQGRGRGWQSTMTRSVT